MSYAPLPTAKELASTRARIAAQKVEIEALEAQAARLREKANAVRYEMAANEAYIAPIRRLPFDVLAQIVVICATALGTSPQVLRTLSSVCRKWRDVTLATPRAWSRVIHRTGYLQSPMLESLGSPRYFLQTLRDLQEWFSRGGITLIDINFALAEFRPDEDFNAIWELFYLHVPRARSLSLRIITRDAESRYKRLFAIPMPHLSIVDIDDAYAAFSTPFPAENPWGALYDFLEGLPSLHGLVISRQLPEDFPSSVRNRITSLYCRNVDGRELMRYICPQRGFPALRGLRITTNNSTGWWLDDANFHIESTLEILRLELHSTSGWVVFNHLYVPRLSRLTLAMAESYRWKAETAREHLEALLANSAPPLVDLYLQRVPIEDADLVNVLRRLPLLERFVLLNASITNEVVDALASPPSSSNGGWLCPRLKQVCITTTYGHAANPVSRSGMESLATARRNEWARCKALRIPPAVDYLALIRLENAQLDDGDTPGVWRWKTNPGRRFTYPDIPPPTKGYGRDEVEERETAWAQMESLLL